MTFSDDLICSTPNERERRVAVGIGIAAIAALAVTAPFGAVFAGRSAPVVTLVYTSYVVAAGLTAWLLRHQFRPSAFVPLAVLAVGYAYGAVIIAAYLLTFPGVFSASGLLGAGSQTATWLWVCAHIGFIAFAFLYVFAERVYGRTQDHPRAERFVRAVALGAAALSSAVIVVTTAYHDRLPLVVANGVSYTPLLRDRIVPLIMLCYAAAFISVTTLARSRTVTSLWIRVVIVALFGEVTAGALLSGGRFSWAWYVGMIEGAIAAMAFLIVMLQQMNQILVAFAVSNRFLAEESERDHLTELLNRRGFDDRIADVFRRVRRNPTPVALLIIDIDHFKAYNDHFGHVRGDHVLRLVARAMAGAMSRSRDSCCRIGGEEFAVVLPATDEDGAIVVGQRLRRSIAALDIPQAPELAEPSLTVSIGVAATDREPDADAKRLYERADAALYEAKRLGRNRLARHSALLGNVKRRATLVSR